MTARIDISVFCDNCGKWEHGGGTENKAKARAYVLRHFPGWKSRRVHGQLVDLCPNCETVAEHASIPADVFDHMHSIDLADPAVRARLCAELTLFE